MYDRRRRIRSQARPALLWTLLFFLTGNLVIGLYLHRRHPEFFDPEVSMRLKKLPARLAEAPGRPLALAVGSSRFVLGLRPVSAMAQTQGDRNQALLFNFSLLGAGPVGQRLIVHRLLRKGIRPKWMFVEVWAPILTQKFPFTEETRTFHRAVYWPDVSILGRLYHRGWEAAGQLIAETLTPAVHRRDTVLRHYAPTLLQPLLRQFCDTGFEKHLQYHLDDFGWVEYEILDDGTQAAGARRHGKPLFDNFSVSDISDRALSGLLAECRAHGIQVVLVLMPDHSLVRSWYALMQGRFLRYLRRLSAENHAPIVDARAWQPDEDIPDYSHLSPKGARAFSERFGREVYRPLIQGQPLPQNVLLRDP